VSLLRQAEEFFIGAQYGADDLLDAGLQITMCVACSATHMSGRGAVRSHADECELRDLLQDCNALGPHGSDSDPVQCKKLLQRAAQFFDDFYWIFLRYDVNSVTGSENRDREVIQCFKCRARHVVSCDQDGGSLAHGAGCPLPQLLHGIGGFGAATTAGSTDIGSSSAAAAAAAAVTDAASAAGGSSSHTSTVSKGKHYNSSTPSDTTSAINSITDVQQSAYAKGGVGYLLRAAMTSDQCRDVAGILSAHVDSSGGSSSSMLPDFRLSERPLIGLDLLSAATSSASRNSHTVTSGNPSSIGTGTGTTAYGANGGLLSGCAAAGSDTTAAHNSTAPYAEGTSGFAHSTTHTAAGGTSDDTTAASKDSISDDEQARGRQGSNAAAAAAATTAAAAAAQRAVTDGTKQSS
jgi:hypothetical protein